MLAGTWQQLADQPQAGSGTTLLLTDGSVISQGSTSSSLWSRLTPDANGNYQNGTWLPIAPMITERMNYGSVVLPDGRVFVVGGEVGRGNTLISSSLAEIYDPSTDTWTAAASFPVAGFGDGPVKLLPNGKILAGATGSTSTYLYNPTTNSWAKTGNKLHTDANTEESWVLLSDGSVLSYDAGSGAANTSQRYNSSTGKWINAGVVPVTLSDATGTVGAASLLPDGRVMLLGGNNQTAFYTPATNTWAAGPVVGQALPVAPSLANSPAAMLPNGHLLFMSDQGTLGGPSRIFDYDPTGNTTTDITAGFPSSSDLGGNAAADRMLVLPNGHVLFNTGTGKFWDYTPSGAPLAAWKPTISSIVPSGLTTFTLTGTQLNGISEGATYGDDAAVSTNYPIVRLRNSLNQIRYASSFGWTPGVATGAASRTVQFTPPTDFDPTATLFVSVIANGIASAEQSVSVPAPLKDIVTGTGDSSPRFLTNVNGTLFFVADDRQHGAELWKSDGTQAGTVLVKDIRPGVSGSSPQNLVNVNGTLYFTATTTQSGTELWKSDGTAAGTVLVSDIRTGVAGSAPSSLTNVNGTLYFIANDGINGVEVWKSNGTAAGTSLVKDIRTGALSSHPANLFNHNGTLYFTADDGVTGNELWKSNGTTAGTSLVKDILVGTTTSNPLSLTSWGSTLFFTANNGINGTELWRTDGTTAGTVMVKDIEPQFSVGSIPQSLTVLGSKLYFQATTAAAGAELWSSDGTAAGTTLVKDLNPGAAGSAPLNLFAFNGALYFQASNAAQGAELWKSDGTSAGTTLFADLNPGSGNSSPSSFTSVGATLYFKADDGATGAELWKTDGTVLGTTRVSDYAFGLTSSNPTSLVNVNGKLFFSATNGFNGFELWVV